MGYDSSAGKDIKDTLEKKQNYDMKKDLQKPQTNNSGRTNYTGNAALSNLGVTSNNRLY
jgi:hypothetical protein